MASTTATTPSGIAGRFIRSVSVRTDGPAALPIAGSWLSNLRRTTESGVVKRQLLFASGERVDTARIAETLRRLRDRRLYADVSLSIAQCSPSDSVDLTIITRDAWTLTPVARIVPPATVSIGAQDMNLLGSGRSVSMTNDQTTRGHGGSVGLVDPFLFGSDVVGAFRFADVAGNHLLRASVRHPEVGTYDPWDAEAAVGRQTFSDPIGSAAGTDHPLGNFFLATHLGHLVGSGATALIVPYAGAEVDSAQVMALRRGDTVPSLHSRRFIGLDMGASRRAAQFDTVGWFNPGHGFLDIPRGLEADALVSPGFDRAQHAAAVRYDAWMARIWIPNRASIVAADAWTSGFVGDVRANHTDRFSITGYGDAHDGFWGARLTVEQLIDLDPDLRIMSLVTGLTDPTFAAIPQPYRLADRAAFATIERSVHLMAVGRGAMLDGALFGAASERWDVPDTAAVVRRFGVGVIGARLRLFSTNGASTSMRLDVSYPVRANAPVARRPMLLVSVNPLFDAARMRDGFRRQH